MNSIDKANKFKEYENFIDKKREFSNKSGNEILLEDLLSFKIKMNKTLNALNQSEEMRKLYDDLKIFIDTKIQENKLPEQTSEEFYFKQGLIYHQLEDYDRAGRNFEKAFLMNKSKKVYIFHQRLAFIDKELINDHNNSRLLNSKGDYLYKLKEFEKAVSCFDLAIDIDPQTALYYFNKANALKKLKLLKNAQDCFAQAFILDPSNTDFLYTKEINLIDIAIQSNLNKHELYNSKGCFLIRLKNYIRAGIEFDKALSLDPNNADYHYHKGIALSEMNIFNQANDCFTKAKELNSNKKDYSIYRKINILNEKIKNKPFNSDYLSEKGKFLFELGDLNPALICFNKAIKINAKNDVYYVNAAIVLAEMEKFEESDFYLKEATHINPESAEKFKLKKLE